MPLVIRLSRNPIAEGLQVLSVVCFTSSDTEMSGRELGARRADGVSLFADLRPHCRSGCSVKIQRQLTNSRAKGFEVSRLLGPVEVTTPIGRMRLVKESGQIDGALQVS